MTTPMPPDLAEQLKQLQPICTLRHQSLGYHECGRPAVAIVEVHATHQCTGPELTRDGGIVETLCAGCLATVRATLTQYAQRNSYLGAMVGAYPCCGTCGRPQVSLSALLTVQPIGGSL
jgi:hypothetical protein